MTYTISQIKAAGEKGEINHHDVNHLIKMLQELSPQTMSKEAEEIAKETHYEDLACEILQGVEFKDEPAIAQAALQLSNYLRENLSSPQEAGEITDDEARQFLLDYDNARADNFSFINVRDVYAQKLKKWMRSKLTNKQQ